MIQQVITTTLENTLNKNEIRSSIYSTAVKPNKKIKKGSSNIALKSINQNKKIYLYIYILLTNNPNIHLQVCVFLKHYLERDLSRHGKFEASILKAKTGTSNERYVSKITYAIFVLVIIPVYYPAEYCNSSQEIQAFFLQ